MSPKVPKVAKASGKGVRPYSPLHMFNLELKVAEEGEEHSGNELEDKSRELVKSERGEDRLESKAAAKQSFSHAIPPSGFLPRVSRLGAEDLQAAGWCVCDHGLAPTGPHNHSDDPLPPLPSGRQNVMPHLQDCLEEEDFHREIYYSKKYVSGRQIF